MKSNSEWRAWGKLDPLYGVATVPDKAKTGTQPWNDAEFYAAGAGDWARTFRRWQQYGVTRGSCLEIGCGAGRITLQLAKDFARVHAVDVSPDMIEYAKRNVLAGAVEFHETDGRLLPLENESIDAVFSTHVFQHFDSVEDGETNFREMYRVLRTNGSIMVHLPVSIWPDGGRKVHRFVDRARRHAGRLRANYNRAAYRAGLRARPVMRMTWYELGWVQERLPALGFRDLEVSILFGNELLDNRHTFVLARK